MNNIDPITLTVIWKWSWFTVDPYLGSRLSRSRSGGSTNRTTRGFDGPM